MMSNWNVNTPDQELLSMQSAQTFKLLLRRVLFGRNARASSEKRLAVKRKSIAGQAGTGSFIIIPTSTSQLRQTHSALRR